MCACVVCVHSVRVCCLFISMCDREESTQGIPQRDAIAPTKERGFQICQWREEEEEAEAEAKATASQEQKRSKHVVPRALTHNQMLLLLFSICFFFWSFAFRFISISLHQPIHFLHSVLAVFAAAATQVCHLLLCLHWARGCFVSSLLQCAFVDDGGAVLEVVAAGDPKGFKCREGGQNGAVFIYCRNKRERGKRGGNSVSHLEKNKIGSQRTKIKAFTSHNQK